MGKLSEMFKDFKEKWEKQGAVKKAVISVLTVAVIGSLIYIATYLGSTKYDVLFKDMDPNDSGAITSKLKEKKVQYQVKGNSILVPRDQVDKLRMEMLSEVTLTNGSKGWELLDSSSKFGVTDEQMKSNYQRALQGEIERTIKSFPQIENARVIIVPAEDSAFVKDLTPASASVALKLKKDQNLTKQQVSAIISLVAGSVKNLPKENIQVVDDKMKTLSSGVFDKDSNISASEEITDEAVKRQNLKIEFEKVIEEKITRQLSPIYKDGVRVTVNADLDFDANQTTSTIVSNGQVISEHSSKETNSQDQQTKPSASPVDNNMTNSTPANTNSAGTNNTKEESTKNYEVSKSESKTIKAPGDIRKISASVVLNGNIDEDTKNKIKNLVSSAISFDEKRGDSISVEGLPFDTSSKNDVKKALDDMNKTAQLDAKYKFYKEIGIGVGVALLFLVILLVHKKRNKKNEDLYVSDIMDDTRQIDLVVGDEPVLDTENLEDKSSVKFNRESVVKPSFKPIEFEEDTEDAHVEREVKKYAIGKPDQVADIIKSWLADDER